jgi:hypothetical protein
MSYKELTATDAIVGIYPTSSLKPAAVHFSSLKRKDGPAGHIVLLRMQKAGDQQQPPQD